MSLETAKDAIIEKNIKNKDDSTEDVEMSTADPKESADSGETGSKRPHKKDGGPPTKRKKTECAQPKNALMQLNELKPGLKYVIESQEGPPHNPIFIAYVEVNDEKFIGKGPSKQLAKHAAAEAALKSFVQFRNMSDVFQSLSSSKKEPVSVDFTDDSVIADNVFSEQEQIKGGDGTECTYRQHRINNKLRKFITESEKKNPLVLLNNIRPGLVYNCAKENPLSFDQRFVMTIDLDSEQFEGAGPSKKAAKAAVARAVLSQKYGVKFHSYTAAMDETDMVLFDFPQELADKMGKLVHDSVDEIAPPSKGIPQWKVLAGVIMTKDEDMTDMQVICFGTGTKSLKGVNMSLNGAVLNDCHAEVIARRCLKDFFFTQLELHVNGLASQSIFEKVVDGKFKLKPNYRFHFYVTSAPCGDAGVFPVHEEDIIAELNTEQTGYKSGVLRTKLESGNGTLPVETSLSEQKAADIHGQTARYQIMSCSDKITTWNILGVQGSLLHYFIEPIYFHTIIIGQLFHQNHMANAIFKRIQPALGNLTSPFVLCKPKLTSTSTWATRHLVQAPQVSINWTCNLESPELVVAKTGKTKDGQVSRLAKRQFFQRFDKIHNILLKTQSPQSKLYGAVKKASPNYAQTKEMVVKAFFTCGLGIWKRKPAEQEWFDLNF